MPTWSLGPAVAVPVTVLPALAVPLLGPPPGRLQPPRPPTPRLSLAPACRRRCSRAAGERAAGSQAGGLARLTRSRPFADYVYFENSSSNPYLIRRIEELNKVACGPVPAGGRGCPSPESPSLRVPGRVLGEGLGWMVPAEE